MAAFNAESEKNCWLRSLAMMKRVATCTATSTLALSRARYGRAGTMAVLRHLGIGAVDRRLVEAGLGDARAQIVGHHHRRSPADEGKGARMRADPVGQALRPGGLGIGVARRAERGDEK